MKPRGTTVNDVHSQLNATRVQRIVAPATFEALRRTIHRARRSGSALCIAGGRHAMGTQQFGTDAWLVDTRRLNRVLHFDPERGRITVQGGIQWPELVRWLLRAQAGQSDAWGIAQKQTGADRMSLAGSLAANTHGRGLRMKPLIADVESFVLVDASGDVHRCSRTENSELFRLVIGGYGLFGVVYEVTLRLAPRQRIERVVEIVDVDDLLPCFAQRIADGFLYGDFQYQTDERSADFLRRGVFSCYRPVESTTPMPRAQRHYSRRQWRELLYLAHTDKRRAFDLYADYYRSTSGQIYWSDTHQLSTYLDDYHRRLDRRLGAGCRATEMITEVFVPRQTLTDFLEEARDDFRRRGVNVIYGTIRLVERDDESFLAWATQPCVGIIFNLHTVHTPEGVEHTAQAFRRLIDRAFRRGGSYYLTYHRFAAREQVVACYPQFPEFLQRKRRYDPEERFQSDWYRHYRALLTEA